MSVAKKVSGAVCFALPALLLTLGSDASPGPPTTNVLCGFINSNRTLTFVAPARALTVDTQERAAVAAFFDSVYSASEGVASGYTGNYASCTAGTISFAYQQAGTTRIAYFRAMVGLPSEVALSADWNARCQAAALMMTANQQLSHSPPASWTCYTAAGAEAAGKSNLAAGYSTLPAAVTGWVLDTSVLSAGHRRWVLYPPEQTMGVGATFGNSYPAYALWVIGGFGTRPATPEWVAWPPRGYVPYQVVGGLWSFSYPSADFTAATVAVTWDGAAIGVRLEAVANGYGDNTLCWTVLGYSTARPTQDVRYHVTLDNVRIGGTPRTFAYDVTVIDPAATAGVTAGEPDPAPRLQLSPGAPNPFTAMTTLRYSLPAASQVSIVVFDVSGRRVTELVRARQAAGTHTVAWDGRGGSGEPASPGLYVCWLAAGGEVVTRRILLIR